MYTRMSLKFQYAHNGYPSINPTSNEVCKMLTLFIETVKNILLRYTFKRAFRLQVNIRLLLMKFRYLLYFLSKLKSVLVKINESP